MTIEEIIEEVKEKLKDLRLRENLPIAILLMVGVALTVVMCSNWDEWEKEKIDAICDDNPCDDRCPSEWEARCRDQECDWDPSLSQCDYLRNENNKQEPVDEHIKDAQKQIEETKKKSELRSTAPQDICIDNYLGAKYKKGTCEFPVYERMTGRAGLEKKFGNCQINEIIPGKNNTATVKAVCMGVPSIIHVKNYKVLQRGSKDGR